MGIFSSLNREQKQSVWLLQAGTFFEFFDLMLYVHMAVLLNELFFPKTDPHTASLLAAFALCSSLAFRPLGALLFGWIGDHIGRKQTIVITTSLMALSCVVMVNLPTYAQIGMVAAWGVTICRIVQGISSMGEFVTAGIYLTETISRPAVHPAVALSDIAAGFGILCALGVAVLVLSFGLNWRFAFGIGATIAVVSAFARTRLRETPDFLEMKRQWLKKEIHEANIEADPVNGAKHNATWKEPVEGKTLLSYFFLTCGGPLSVYLAYFYFNPTLKEFGYTPEDIIRHNFFLSMVFLFAASIVAYLSYSIHPLKISRAKGVGALLLMVCMPFLIINSTSPTHLFMIQAMILVVGLHEMPSAAVFLSHFPLYRRVTYATFLWSMARAAVYIPTSFGLVYLSSVFGPYGIWAISLPVGISYLCSIKHFESLERSLNLYPDESRTPYSPVSRAA